MNKRSDHFILINFILCSYLSTDFKKLLNPNFVGVVALLPKECTTGLNMP